MRIRFTNDPELGSNPSRTHRAAAARGEQIRLHRSAYLDLDGRDADTIDAETLHAARTLAAAEAMTGVISGVSAANLYGFPLLRERLEGPVRIIREHHGTVRDGVRVRRARLERSEIVEMHGMRVTTPVRTIRDLADFVEPHELLAVADDALRQGYPLDDLPSTGRHCRLFAKIKQHASPRSDSFAESWCRWLIIAAGLPEPVLQMTIVDESGRSIGRTDLGWPWLGLVFEFDGAGKYEELLAPEDTSGAAIMREKRREGGILDLGWTMSRAVWSTVATPGALVRRVQADLRSAAAKPAPRGGWREGPLRPAKPRDWSALFGRPR